MREGSKWLHLLLAGLLACSLALAGCSGDDGRDGQDGKDFELPPAQTAGILACSTCHGTGSAAKEWVESKHAMNSSHSISGCATECHNPSGAMFDMDAAFGVTPTGTAVGCEDCHGPGSNHANLPLQEQVANTAPVSTDCAKCHDAAGELAHLTHHPFNEQLYTRYANSGHGSSGHGGGFCAACHSHQGGVLNIEQGRKTSVQQLFEEYSIDTVPFWSMEEETGLLDMQCNTCHDPHTADLRAEDTIESFTYDDDADVTTPDVTEETVVFSAEFNLCTSCHMIDLQYEPAGHGDAGLLLSYELTDAYSAANLVDVATGTFKEVELAPFYNPDGTERSPRVVYDGQVFYHDNTPHGGRNFSDTHFAGAIVGRMAAVEEDETQVDPTAVTDVQLAGYKINPANPDACTVCHDPHSANKVQGEEGVAQAQSFGEGIGTFHTNYLGDAMGHGCQPCHAGNEGFVAWTKGGSMPTDRTADVIACRACHELEQDDPTAVRTFPEGHEFAFQSGAVADVADLGVNQICFECHKGRDGVKPGADTTTQVYGVTYMHYAPSMAILFGAESQMVPTYEGKTYAGKFVHGGGPVDGVSGTEFGCVDCHNVHDTDGNDVAQNKMTNSDYCFGCHQAGSMVSADVLRDRTVAFGERLRATIIDEYNTRFDPDITADEFHTIISSRGAASEIGANDLAKAASIYKIFNYEDGSPVGTEHGHGGAWAHNSRFARQVQYDAIEALNGDLTGLTRPQ